MARARMLLATLGSSRKFAHLADNLGPLGEFGQTLYQLLIPKCDDFGRQSGDAFTVKHAVFPSSSRTEAEFEDALNAMGDVGLVTRYEVDDTVVLQVLKFEDAQGGLHKRTHSHFPDPPKSPAIPGKSRKFREVPGKSRKAPEVPASRARAELNGIELNGIEGNRNKDLYGGADTVVATVGEGNGTTNGEIGLFLKHFCELYPKHRHGAKYVIHRAKHVPLARELLKVYGLKRLERLCVVLLTTDDEWIEDTDRGLGILSTKAAWLDNLLAEYEAKHGVTVEART